jgi:tetratricopeptide (TPR) repeat protein
MGRYGTARAIAESVLERDPEQPDLWFRLARVCELQGDIACTVDAFRRGQEYGPLPRAAEWLARYFYKTGHTRLAIREAVRGLEASPGDAQLHYTAGICYDKNGNTKDAAEHLQRAVDLDPQLGPAWVALVEGHIGRQEMDVALLETQTLETLLPESAWADYARGRYALAIRDASPAVEHLTAAVEAAPNDARWIRYLAEARLLAGDPEGAIEACRQALELDPGSGNLYYIMGQAWLRMREVDEGRRAMQVAQLLRGDTVKGADSLDPDHPAYPAVQRTVARELLDQGKPEEAVKHARLGLDADPEDLALRRTLALCYRDLGEYDKALGILEDFHTLAAADLNHLYFLADIYERAGMTGKAMETWEKALHFDPQFQEAKERYEALTADQASPGEAE